jgi:hypothetical protein
MLNVVSLSVNLFIVMLNVVVLSANLFIVMLKVKLNFGIMKFKLEHFVETL